MALLFDTPIPIVLAVLGLLLLTSPHISSKRWAKIGRWLCGGFLVFMLFAAFQGMNAKGTIGARKSDAHDVTIFTAEVSRLIDQGKYQKAKVMLDKFNDEYPALAGQDKAKKFLLDLAETARNR